MIEYTLVIVGGNGGDVVAPQLSIVVILPVKEKVGKGPC